MRTALAFAALTTAALVVRSHLKVRDALPNVAPELRSPLLPFVATAFTERKLRFGRLLLSIPTKPCPGVTMVKRHVGDPPVPVLMFTPDQRSTPAPGVLWLHGGGYIVGTPEFEAAGSARLARDLGTVVVSPGYRLAPENPFPAGLDDCMAVLRWMCEMPASWKSTSTG